MFRSRQARPSSSSSNTLENYFTVNSLDAFAYDPKNDDDEDEVEEVVTESVTLDEDQQAAVDAVAAGKSIFLTGPAGSGKSLVIKEIIKRNGGKTKCMVTSSTGISAIGIGGVTLHSFFKLHEFVDVTMPYKHAAKLRQNDDFMRKMSACRILVIDEVSMIDAALLDFVAKLCQYIRGEYSTAFGGIQAVVVGDFGQLKPVTKTGQPQKEWAFKAEVFSSLTICTLSVQHRQGNDARFAEVLEHMRMGTLTKQEVDWLMLRENAPFPNDGIEPVYLFGRTASADKLNKEKLEQLDASTEHVYTGRLTIEKSAGKMTKKDREAAERYIVQHYRVKSELTLRRGCSVMLLINLDLPHLGNGSQGVVQDFDEDGYPIVRFTNSMVRVIRPKAYSIPKNPSAYSFYGKFSQLPLMVSYAYTIHKSQGQTIDRIVLSLTKADTFEENIAYVGWTRGRSYESYSTRGFFHFVDKQGEVIASSIRTNADSVRFNRQCIAASRSLKRKAAMRANSSGQTKRLR